MASEIMGVTIGDALLYAGLASGVVILLGLLYSDLRNTDALNRPIRWLIRGFALFLSVDFILLLYYFAVSDFSVNYVWSFSSKYYPLYYKLSGALAGQQGTLLFWAALIAVGSLWLSETFGGDTEFVRKSQIIVVFLGIYFAFLTQLDSPFMTIYSLYPELRAANNPNLEMDFVPEDGNGLNPLLLDPWMATHPFTTFLGYAGTTVPFAGAMIYLLKTFRGQGEQAAFKMWIKKGIQWLRVSWLFSTLSMAFGGIWAYKSLGWGGFWAWDPVETAMLLPWIMLTGAMHTVIEHKRAKDKYTILAPVLTSFSFSMVVYATMVTRSGVFESVHSFISGDVGKYVVLMAGISFVVPLILGVIKYMTTESREDEEKSIVNRTNIFYAAILVFLIMTFISWFGITYPPIIKLLTQRKHAVTAQFFNVWLYPFFIAMLLLIGLALQYRPSDRVVALKTFLAFTGLTILAAFIKPNENFNIVDYTAIVSAEKPFLYGLISAISALSVIPPTIYIIYAIEERWKTRSTSIKKMDARVKEYGVLLIHLGVALIALGAVFASLFVSDFSVSINQNDQGKIIGVAPANSHEGFGKLGTWGVHAGEGTSPYSVKLIEFRKYTDLGTGVKKDQEVVQGITVTQLMGELSDGDVREKYLIRGLIEDVVQVEHNTYIKLGDGENILWVALDKGDIPKGLNVLVDGFIMSGFSSPSLNTTFDVIMFAEHITENNVNQDGAENPYKTVQEVELEVYKHTELIGKGRAKLETYKNGDARRVMISRSLTRDVFVVFDGFGSDGSIPLTVKMKPLMNEIWIGVVLFIIGIVLTIFSDRD